jgi:hypothetical protein
MQSLIRLSSTMLNVSTPGSFAAHSCWKIGTSVADVWTSPRRGLRDISFFLLITYICPRATAAK